MPAQKQVRAHSQPATRRRQRRKEARPHEIVEAAMQLWAEKGFAATRLEDVAAKAGVAKGTIYVYFPSKEALFEAALRQTLVTTMDAAGEHMGRFEGDTQALLQAFFERVLVQLNEGRSIVLFKILIGEGHRFPALLAMHREVAVSRGSETVQRILQRGVERGELRPEAPGTDPRIVIGPIMVAALWSLVYIDATFLPLPQLISQHAAMIVRGLAKD